MMLHIVTNVGARPQFIKAAPICRALREAGHQEYLVHTGQHYDANVQIFTCPETHLPLYGDGKAAFRCIRLLEIQR